MSPGPIDLDRRQRELESLTVYFFSNQKSFGPNRRAVHDVSGLRGYEVVFPMFDLESRIVDQIDQFAFAEVMGLKGYSSRFVFGEERPEFPRLGFSLYVSFVIRGMMPGLHERADIESAVSPNDAPGFSKRLQAGFRSRKGC